MTTKYVIFDCDGGSDDAWALLMLIKAHQEKRIVLLGVTICGCGNTDLENAAKNTLRILKASDSLNIPVYLGASDPLLPKRQQESTFKFHGEDGFGDVLIEDDLNIKDFISESDHGVCKINELCSAKPKQITLISTGPLTNIALCYAMYPNFVNDVKDLFIMGGNYQGVGNFTRAAEFNFYCDPEAAHIVLEKSICPVTILPWEPCMSDRFAVYLNWRLEVLGPLAETCNEAIKTLNKVEHAQYSTAGFEVWNPCDAMLTAVYLFENHVVSKSNKWHATVDVLGGHTRGQMVLDHLHEVDKNPKNVRIIEDLNAEFFKTVAEWTVGLKTLNI
ncbi:pyrimidine-specific ribonucleoside hydrolase RihB-like [Teleopsis dalmanni]|uniref:pyrimidine-specific ribonucleoside hydrolase RihB-like n=1 Tax=Teleopsis dalmanni TaxID=139649 RepID=UPI000D3296F7|nr:pyrimidine-specific ribonucleoside hydrolase RihB-like [Teleopsis dalmanni]